LLDYSFQAVKRNWKAVAVYFLIVAVLTLFSLIPFISPVANIVLQIVGIQLMVYYGRPLLKRVGKEELYAFLEASTVKRIFTEKLEVSAGIFLATFIIGTFFLLLFFALLFISGIPVTGELLTGEVEEAVPHLLIRFFIVFLAFILIAGWFFYVAPIAFGYAMSREGFGEAFFAVFRLFTPSFWKRALSFKYFIFITVCGILTFILAFVGGFLFATIILAPVGIAFLYMTNVFFGGVCAESYRMTGEEGELPPKDEPQSLS